MDKTNFMLTGFIAGFLLVTPVIAQETVSREDFYQYMGKYVEEFFKSRQAIDTTLSPQTNLEMQVRSWNHYIDTHLPRKFLVSVPITKVSVGKEIYNRSEVEISYDFKIQFPERNFRFENNLSVQDLSFQLKKINEDREGTVWVTLNPELRTFKVQSNLARKYDILKNPGNLIFEILLNYSHETSWTQYYQTVISLNSIRWAVGEGIIWEAEPLPFETIFYRDRKE
ncbi:MAG: hypothetical protein JXL67_12710 [Calditrichaeota bacterium]|nr:hypothetical protein [Calditrichota bacterium]